MALWLLLSRTNRRFDGKAIDKAAYVPDLAFNLLRWYHSFAQERGRFRG